MQRGLHGRCQSVATKTSRAAGPACELQCDTCQLYMYMDKKTNTTFPGHGGSGARIEARWRNRAALRVVARCC